MSEVLEKPHVVYPLTVVYNRKDGQPGLVLDCRHINTCLHLFKMKYEDIRIAEKLFENGTYIFTFDLRSAYNHIDIFLITARMWALVGTIPTMFTNRYHLS